MVRFKLMYKDKPSKRYYNFRPTVDKNANPEYSQIKSIAKAKKVLRSIRADFGKGRTWKIKRK